MPRFSPQLTRLLVIRGIARALAPLAVLWGIYDWYLFDRLATPPRFPWHALVFALLTANYVLVYLLTWVAPAALNGPWRIRPWQTFVLLANIFLLPIQYYRHSLGLPWGFITVNTLFIIGLYVGTAIYFYLHDRLPMAAVFAAQKAAAQPSPAASTRDEAALP